MKRLILCALFAFTALTSCSSSDDNETTGPATTFLPLTATSAWVYDVNLDTENTGQDQLFVDGETTIDGKVYKKMSTTATPLGFYTNILNNNNVRIDGDKMLLTGSTGLAAADFLPIDITVSDFVIFKENGTNNAQLDQITGSIEQDLQGFPLNIDYKLKSVFNESLSSFTVPGKETYTNVKAIKIVANLKISTVYIVPVIETPITIAVLDAQDVIVSTQYYAEGVGMIYSKTEVNFEINDFSEFGIELPIPQEGSSTIEEFLN